MDAVKVGHRRHHTPPGSAVTLVTLMTLIRSAALSQRGCLFGVRPGRLGDAGVADDAVFPTFRKEHRILLGTAPDPMTLVTLDPPTLRKGVRFAGRVAVTLV
jgi:hypothetical protein